MCPILDKTAGMCVFLLGTRTTSWLISLNTSCIQASNSGALLGSAWTSVFMKNSHLFQCGPQETWHKHFPWRTGSVYDVDNEGIPHCLLSLLIVISAHHRPVPSSKLHDSYKLSLGGIFVPSGEVSFAYISVRWLKILTELTELNHSLEWFLHLSVQLSS